MPDMGLSLAFGAGAATDEVKRILAEQYQKTLDAQKFALEQDNQKRLGEGLNLQKDALKLQQEKAAQESDITQFGAVQGSPATVLPTQTPDPVTHLVTLPGEQPFAPMRIRGVGGAPDVMRTPESATQVAESARQKTLLDALDKPYTNPIGSRTTIPSIGVVAEGGQKEPNYKDEFVNVGGKPQRVKTDEASGKSFNIDTGAEIPAASIQRLPPETNALTDALAQERLDALRNKNKPADISGDEHYTMSGKKYYSAGDYETADSRGKARDAAKSEGAPFVSAAVADGLRAADTARANLDKVLEQISGKLPRDAKGRVLDAPINKASQFFQTDEGLAAFRSWRVAAIQTVQALAEKGMGLRLTKAEIDLATENDIPQITDTWATARQRVANLNALLNSKEDAALNPDRRQMVVPGGVNDSTLPTPEQLGFGQKPALVPSHPIKKVGG